MTDVVPVILYVDTAMRAKRIQMDHDPKNLLVLPVLDHSARRAYSIIVEEPEHIRYGAAPSAAQQAYRDWFEWLPTRLYPLSVKGKSSRITRL